MAERQALLAFESMGLGMKQIFHVMYQMFVILAGHTPSFL
jgi:hypothetical protein